MDDLEIIKEPKNKIKPAPPHSTDQEIESLLNDIERGSANHLKPKKKVRQDALLPLQESTPMSRQLFDTRVDVNLKGVLRAVMKVLVLFLLDGGMSYKEVVYAGINIYKNFTVIPAISFCVYKLAIKLTYISPFERQYFTVNDVQSAFEDHDCLHLLGLIHCENYRPESCTIRSAKKIDSVLQYLAIHQIIETKTTAENNITSYRASW